MQPGIQGKNLLHSHIVSSGRGCGDEYQIPAVQRHRAGYHDKLVLAQKLVAVALLSSAGNSRPEPVEIRKRCRIDDMNGRGVGNRQCRQDVSNCIQNAKAFMNGNFEDGRRRIDRAVHGADALSIPAPTVPKRSFTAGPGRSVLSGIEAPPVRWNCQ